MKSFKLYLTFVYKYGEFEERSIRLMTSAITRNNAVLANGGPFCFPAKKSFHVSLPGQHFLIQASLRISGVYHRCVLPVSSFCQWKLCRPVKISPSLNQLNPVLLTTFIRESDIGETVLRNRRGAHKWPLATYRENLHSMANVLST